MRCRFTVSGNHRARNGRTCTNGSNAKEVRELFGAFGQLKTVRMPEKFDGTHRGFAFVEFASKGEATKAISTAALRATHLYRPLSPRRRACVRADRAAADGRGPGSAQWRGGAEGARRIDFGFSASAAKDVRRVCNGGTATVEENGQDGARDAMCGHALKGRSWRICADCCAMASKYQLERFA